MKLRPNDPCFCGSGNKLKKCHGSLAESPASFAVREPVDLRPAPSAFSLPGLPILLTIARRSSTDVKMNEQPIGGSPGAYDLIFVLSKPIHAPLAENHVNGDPSSLKGDSHLSLGIGNRASFLDELVLGHAFGFEGTANDSGNLERITMTDLPAESFKDALKKGHSMLSPLLSRTSTFLDIPLHVYCVNVVEKATGNVTTAFTGPFFEKTIAQIVDTEPPGELMGLCGIYREALNSNSPNYQFLCYYRIIEGIGGIQRREAKASQKAIENPEALPATVPGQTSWMNNVMFDQQWSPFVLHQVFLPQAVGKTIDELIRKSGPLDNIRNKIGHVFFKSGSGDIFTLDSADHLELVQEWLPLCKCIAIHLLKKTYPAFFPKVRVVRGAN